MSEIKVNKISPRTNCGTVQLGDSGDTITIPAGATITNNGTAAGFGSTGEISWDTTKKTGDFTGVSGVGYFVDTTSAVVTVTLPSSPSAGNVVGVADYNGTAETNSITVARNSSNINGAADDFDISKNFSTVQFIYVDATVGWKTVFTGNPSDAQNIFVAATGGTITCCGNFKIHTFTGPGTFTVTNAGSAAGSNTVDYLVIAGGGSGGTGSPSYNNCGEGGGGGAGGYRESSGAASGSYTTSPLGSCVSALPVTAQGYPITVGAGAGAASAGSNTGCKGSNSVFSTITSAGGGGGQGRSNPSNPTSPIPAAPACGQKTSGGSGGGAGNADNCASSYHFGSGNHPPVSPPQGNPGGRSAWPSPSSGDGYSSGGGGGGGATTVGGNSPGITVGGTGGSGATSCITASPVTRAGGGGGSSRKPGTAGSGGPGGGGAGSVGNDGGTAGTTNTGSGGGGGGGNTASGAGGSGIVVIRYKFQ